MKGWVSSEEELEFEVGGGRNWEGRKRKELAREEDEGVGDKRTPKKLVR